MENLPPFYLLINKNKISHHLCQSTDYAGLEFDFFACLESVTKIETWIR